MQNQEHKETIFTLLKLVPFGQKEIVNGQYQKNNYKILIIWVKKKKKKES